MLSLLRSCSPVALALLSLAVAGDVDAQQAVSSPLNAFGAAKGVQVYNVSAFSAWYSGGLPFGGIASSSASQPADLYSGVSAAMGWSTSGKRSSASITYSPSYMRTARNSQISAMSHSGTLNWSTELSRKWSFSASGAALASDLDRLSFGPANLGSAVSAPATFDELAGAVLGGRSSDSRIAGLLTGFPDIASPESAFAYGRRVLSTSAQATLVYAPSERTSLYMGGSATRAQTLQTPSSGLTDTDDYLVRHTSAAAVDVGWSHSLTPRTKIGADVVTRRLMSPVQDAYTTSTTASIGRKMSQRWFVDGRFGVGVLSYRGRVSARSSGARWVGGGAIGYKTLAHTVLATQSRTVADVYGLGSTATTMTRAAWYWRRPSSGWSLSGIAGYQRLHRPLIAEYLESWTARAGVSRKLSAHAMLSANYGYFELPAVAVAAAVQQGKMTRKGVVVSLAWSPAAQR